MRNGGAHLGLAAHAIAATERIPAGVGRLPREPVGRLADGGPTAALTHAPAGTVTLVDPEQPPYESATQSSHDLRTRSA